MKGIGLYIHIPFCVRKCYYCDFCSFPHKEPLFDVYVDRVLNEMRAFPGEYQVETLFVGGGTPSLLPPALMDRLLSGLRERFAFSPSAECTVEMNPGTVSEELLSVLSSRGINRVSLGVQALQDPLLFSLGRIHTAEKALSTLEMVKRAGFPEINCDVMTELPGQTAQDLRFTLRTLLSKGITHLSCYALIPEEHTPLGEQILQGKVKKPPEEEMERMDDALREETARFGFLRYEISNYALPGHECRHNRDCWRRREYLGFGCAAAGFVNGTRYVNCRDLQGYLRGEPPEMQAVSPQEARFESVMLGLRMSEGVDLAAFEKMHGLSLEEAFGDRLLLPVRQGLAEWAEGHYRLTDRGLDLQNSVLLTLMGTES